MPSNQTDSSSTISILKASKQVGSSGCHFPARNNGKHKFQQPAAISRSQIMSTKWRVMWIGEGSWSWRTWRFPQACVFGGNKTVLYTASSQIRLMDKFLHQFERFETHTQNLRKWDVDVDYIIHRLTCSSPSTKCSKQSMVSSSWPQQ